MGMGLVQDRVMGYGCDNDGGKEDQENDESPDSDSRSGRVVSVSFCEDSLMVHEDMR
jgi:hypothetical protein